MRSQERWSVATCTKYSVPKVTGHLPQEKFLIHRFQVAPAKNQPEVNRQVVASAALAMNRSLKLFSNYLPKLGVQRGQFLITT